MKRLEKYGSRLATGLGSIILALSLVRCGADDSALPVGHAPAALLAAEAWTSRDIWSLRNVTWSSHRNLTAAALQQVSDARAAEGMIPLDLSAVLQGGDIEYATVWRENVDGRDFRAHWDLDTDQYAALWAQYQDEGFRPLTVTSYLFGGIQYFAGIWIENREGLNWTSYRGLTSDEYAARFEELRGQGYRPIDIDAYDTANGLRYATIWYENSENVQWAQLRNLSRDAYQAELDRRSADGYLIIDYDQYGGQYAAIWEQPTSRPGYTVRTGRGARDFANLWRQYRDEGLRPFHLEEHGGDEFGGIWIQDSDRYGYPRKGDIDAATIAYRDANTLPGISVAVLRAGQVIYERGFGWADENDEKAAHAETVYSAASVSKVFGGTLAAKLEETGALIDGTSVSLDLRQPTSWYLPAIPAQHTHTVEQLTAHLGCVAHYDTTPAIADQTTHYDTAYAAAQSIWGTPLVAGCSVGTTWSYSTGGFTLVGAVLEEVTRRNIHALIASEIAGPYGLSSLRSQWATGGLPDNYERAAPYDSSNREKAYDDSSWKVLGGGLELHVVDLARFGGLVLSGQIVSPRVRDQRLFTPVDRSCTGRTGGTCLNGVAWELGDNNGRFIAEHEGSAVGARSFLRVYPNDDLVVAIMSNRTDHDLNSLGTGIADIVLAP